ncbi:hypothetical protein SmJEL517_g05220 [Synchytrium microbalum]|uniref:Endothelin-converting enzyme 1 n=1 Tax=Synchytrium microbalum TaxID=1806994 RepID=A0A507BQE1_9FUNG|nr:uncharacterized protein SmJEL517_g05220 [Synchytrium microbalum]TPX31457.1 hypothetical protein SmJEL517_g05220 [Synchytrium microbalum]
MSQQRAPDTSEDAPLLENQSSSTRQRFEASSKRAYWIVLAVVLAILGFLALWIVAPGRDQDNEMPCLTAECVVASARIIKAMDATVDPCDDFYEYSCAGWIQSHPLPPSKSRIGTFDDLQDENQLVLKTVLESKYIQDPNLTDPEQQKADKTIFTNIQNLYKSCMNETTIDARGAAPLQALIKQASQYFPLADTKGKISSANFTKAVALWHDYGLGPFFDLYVGPDAKEPEVNVITMTQSGLGLPSKDYYKDDKVLAVYQSGIDEIASLLSLSELVAWNVSGFGAGVVAFEKAVAKVSWDPVDLQTPGLTYNPYNISQLATLSSSIVWDTYFGTRFPKAKFPDVNKPNTVVIVEPPSYYSNLTAVIQSTKPVALQNYMLWHLIKRYAKVSSATIRAPIRKIEAQLTGSLVEPPRYETCLRTVDGIVGMPVGKYFVQKAFGAESKLAVERGIDNVKQSMIDRLQSLPWIDAETRKEAIEKVKTLRRKIGYPDYILNPTDVAAKYNGLIDFQAAKYFENFFKSTEWETQDNLANILKPVDFDEFDMSPATVNAYYNPPLNEIVFPAGILQGGFYGHGVPVYLNYGGIGSVIRLRDWWTNATAVEFEKLATCFVDQYGNYTVLDPSGVPQHLNGELTLGENLADNGIMRSYESYQMELAKDPNTNNLLMPGLTQLSRDQLFYISFAQVWCGTVTPQQSIVRLRTDPHSPGRFRVNGVVSDSPHFAKTFSCPAGSNMNPVDKCLLW